jgi:hypothetical protein
MSTDVEVSQAVEGTPWTPAHAAAHVRAAYGRSVGSVFAIGQALAEAKTRLPHGQWEQAVELLPFSATTAKRYARVASNKALAKTANMAGLPASVVALDVLTQLPNPELAKLIADGTVSADTSVADAKDLVAASLRRRDLAKSIAAGQSATPEEHAVSGRARKAVRAAQIARGGYEDGDWDAVEQAGRDAVLAYRDGGEAAAAEVIASLGPPVETDTDETDEAVAAAPGASPQPDEPTAAPPAPDTADPFKVPEPADAMAGLRKPVSEPAEAETDEKLPTWVETIRMWAEAKGAKDLHLEGIINTSDAVIGMYLELDAANQAEFDRLYQAVKQKHPAGHVTLADVADVK